MTRPEQQSGGQVALAVLDRLVRQASVVKLRPADDLTRPQIIKARADVAELAEAATALANEHDALHGECACEGDPNCAACRLRAAIAQVSQ